VKVKSKISMALVVTFVTGLWAFSLIRKPTSATPPSEFALVYEPIGVAEGGDKLLVTTYCENPKQVLALDSGGQSRVFATLPQGGRPPGCNEDYLAVSPGLGGFQAGGVFVKQGGRILRISVDGKDIGEFAVLPTGDSIHGGGITFDRIGTFGYEMIVSSREGKIWRINPAGRADLIVSRLKAGGRHAPSPDARHAGAEEGETGFSTNITENVAVAPRSLKPFGGHILVASETNNTIYAVSPAGRVKVAAKWPRAEGIYFIPSKVCALPGSGAGFFAAAFTTNQIIKAPARDFAKLGGQALVVSETGTIGVISSDGNEITARPLHNGKWGQLKGAAFSTCP